MKRIGMGIVGAGFVGPHHVDAVRRLGFVDVVAIAGSSDASAKKKAEALGIPNARTAATRRCSTIRTSRSSTTRRRTTSTTRSTRPRIAKGKHVVSDKPLAMTAAEARKLLDQATKAGVVHAVTFNYRGNPLVQQARLADCARQTSASRDSSYGQYLQDWLLKDTDYSWRLEPDKGGASSALGDIGSHWCDLAQHVSGLRITHVLGDITTVIPQRKRPTGAREAFAAAGGDEQYELVDIAVEDLASVLLRFDNGAKGAFSVGQVCAGHKNDLCSKSAAPPRRSSGARKHQNELWIGHRDARERDAAEGSVAARSRRRALRAPARRPSGSLGRMRSAT